MTQTIAMASLISWSSVVVFGALALMFPFGSVAMVLSGLAATIGLFAAGVCMMEDQAARREALLVRVKR